MTKMFRVLAAIASALSLWGVANMSTSSETTECGTSSVTEVSPSLPRLRFLRRLPAFNEKYPLLNMQSGTGKLTWSPDGERLAVYVRNGFAITVWSPDGKIQNEIPRYNFSPYASDNVLGFLAGHSRLLTGQAAPSQEEARAFEDVAFSILDAETGKIIHNVVGTNPGDSFRENIATKAAVSPDQRLVAVVYNVIYGEKVDRRIGVYSTDDWRRVAAVSFGDESPKADAIAFSPDGKMFAVGYRGKFGDNNRVDIFDVVTWTLIRSIETFPDAPRGALASTDAVRFSHDGSMIAVMLGGGGSYWKYPDGRSAPKGKGTLFQTPTPEPLRVFRIVDGSRIASAGGFAGGFQEHKIEWSPIGNFLEFLDLHGLLYFWDPLSSDPPRERCQFTRSTTAVSFSPDGRLLSQSFAEGVNLYEVIRTAVKDN